MTQGLLRILLLVMFLTLVACQSARLQVTEDGRETWRSDRLSFDRSGGSICVRVTGSSDHRVTVFLLGDGAHERLLDFIDIEPLAVGTGHDGFEVRFTELPAGRYQVGAFEDRDRDGALIVRETLAGAMSQEPRASIERIEVVSSTRHEVDLVIEGNAS